MMIVKASIDARPKDLVHQVAGVFKTVLKHATCKRLAVRYDVYMGGAKKKIGDQRRHGSGNAAVQLNRRDGAPWRWPKRGRPSQKVKRADSVMRRAPTLA